MPRDKHTLPVQITRAQKSVLEELSAKSTLSMAEIVRRALDVYVTTKTKLAWPASPVDRRRRSAPVKPRTPLPEVEPTSPAKHLLHWLNLVEAAARAPQGMDRPTWGLMLVQYRRAKAGYPKVFEERWAEMDAHREAIAGGRDLPAEVDVHTRRMLVALWHYEGIRDEWQERKVIDRSKLPPEELQRLRATEAKKSQASRAKKKAEKAEELRAIHEEFCSDIDDADDELIVVTPPKKRAPSTPLTLN